MRRVGPPRERYKFGPACGPLGREGSVLDSANGEGQGGDCVRDGGCLYRPISRGYAPMEGPGVEYEERDGTVFEVGSSPGGVGASLSSSDFLLLMEKIGPDEVATGRLAAGGTGRTLERLLRDNTPLLRSDVYIANLVRCQSIAYEAHETCNGRGCDGCDNGQLPATNDNGDHIDISPSYDQIRECGRRYLDDVLERFEGKYIVCLGAAATYYMLGRAVAISKHRGTIFQPGVTIECPRCRGQKSVPGRKRNCTKCKGRGTLKCKCGGVTKHKKKCEIVVTTGHADYPGFELCTKCSGGKVAGRPKKCPECDGVGEIPEDRDKPHVCDKLKPHQLMMITYHPAAMMKEPAKLVPIVEKDFSRFTKMEEELKYEQSAVYVYYPEAGGSGIANEILDRSLLAGQYSGGVGVGKDVDGRIPNPPLIFDLETTGLVNGADVPDITHFAFTDRAGYGAVIRPDDPRVRRLLESYPVLVGQNVVLFDWWVLEHNGFKIPPTAEVVDTRYLGKLINPDTPNDLPYLTAELADPPLRGYWKAKDDYRRHIERVACIDVDATARVLRGAWDRLEQTGQAEFARQYIIPISRVVFEMRLAGMKVDKSRMIEAQKRVDAHLAERRQSLPDWGGTHTEGQHAKVMAHLYEELQLPIQKKRPDFKKTANKAALETLLGLLGRNDPKVKHLDEEKQQEASEFLNLLLELRDMSKLSNSFLRYRYSADSFVFPELNPVGTATLRPTCSDPNILQVPGCKCKPACHGTEKHKKEDCGPKCKGTNPRCKNARWVFIPDHPGWEIMSVDLSQAEVIGFLWYAEQWDVLNDILNGGQDAYARIATRIFGRDPTSAERDRTKVDTLAFIYGEAERTQALRLRIHVDEIRERREAYMVALPGVKAFREELISKAIRDGFVESPWGVRRYIRVESRRGRAANEACNAPIQNICPMVTGEAMLKLHAQLPKPARLWVPWVYDELNFVYPKELRSEVYEAARDILGGPVAKLPAPAIKMGSGLRFRLDFAVGKDWGHLTPLEVPS